MFRFPGPQREPGGRPAREAETDRGGKGRWSAKRKASVVLELLRGADLESTSRKYGVTAATLSEWRDAFLAAGATPGTTTPLASVSAAMSPMAKISG